MSVASAIQPPESAHCDKMPSTRNAHLNGDPDCLYHFGILQTRAELREQFGDVRFVCMGGTAHRMESFARLLQNKFEITEPIVDLAAKGQRYAMFKVGSVLSVSHGVGSPSFIVALHEIVKLLEYASCKDVTFFRLGTSGGIGVQPGTVVVSTGAVSDTLEECYDFRVLGKIVKRPCILDQELAQSLVDFGATLPNVRVVPGKTMGASDFYEAQGRLDGAICEYSARDKAAFLQTLKERGVVNIEMEAAMFSAFCNHLKLRAAIVCVTLVDRLRGDQISTPKSVLLEWQDAPMTVVAEYIRLKLSTSTLE